MHDSIREEWQVTRLLEDTMSPSCSDMQLGKSATPRTLHNVAAVVDKTSSRLQTEFCDQKMRQRYWTNLSSAKSTDDFIRDGTDVKSTINRKSDDGALLFVLDIIRGAIFNSLIGSGATRSFISPTRIQVAGVQGKKSDTCLELGNGQYVLSRGYVPDVPVTLAETHLLC